jgi:hypothetical protein
MAYVMPGAHNKDLHQNDSYMTKFFSVLRATRFGLQKPSSHTPL